MNGHWEYLGLVLTNSTEYKPPAPQTWSQAYALFWPGNTDPDGQIGTIKGWPDWLALLNRLGREGWELATGTIMDTTIVAGMHGWTQVGTPVRQSFIFKRQTPGT